MKFKQYLNEGLRVVSIKDLPNWVKKILKSKGIRKDVEVDISNKAIIGSNWHDANVMNVYLYKGGKIESQIAIGSQSPNDSKKERQVKQGFTTNLDINKMILVTNTYPKNAKLYVHPDSMAKMIENEPTNDLSKEELLILKIISSLKPFARRKEAEAYNIDFNSIVDTLKNKKYLMKNGGINKNGKNMLINKFGSAFIQIITVAKKLGIKSNRSY